MSEEGLSAGFVVWHSVLLAKIEQGATAKDAASEAWNALREFQKNFHGDRREAMPEKERDGG